MLQFGLEMGTGMRTHSTSAAPFLLGLTFLLMPPSLNIALAGGIAFGIGRYAAAVDRFHIDEPCWLRNLSLLGNRTIALLGGSACIAVLVAL